MAESIDICNQAISLVGGGHITSVNDGTNEARQCKVHYGPALRKILSERWWTFATVRTELAQSADVPTTKYAFAYPIPFDCLKIQFATGEDGLQFEDWVLEDGKILCNKERCFVTYTKCEQDAAKYPGPFESAFVHLLASRIAVGIAQSRGLRDEMYNIFMVELRDASPLDGRQQSSQYIGRRASRLVNARRR